jgi:hypothetical protein
MSAEYPTGYEMDEEEMEQPVELYKVLDSGKLIFTGLGDYYYRPRLERLGIKLDDINTLKRYELVTRLLESIEVEQSKHKVLRKNDFLSRRSAMASERQDLETASRLACLIHNNHPDAF